MWEERTFNSICGWRVGVGVILAISELCCGIYSCFSYRPIKVIRTNALTNFIIFLVYW